MPDQDATRTTTMYAPGDILVDPAEGGGYQISRVSAVGRAHALGFQNSEPAALSTAARATSGGQRVFLLVARGSNEYRLVT